MLSYCFQILDRNRAISLFCVPPTALRLIVKENLSKYTHLRNVKCLSAGEPVVSTCSSMEQYNLFKEAVEFFNVN